MKDMKSIISTIPNSIRHKVKGKRMEYNMKSEYATLKNPYAITNYQIVLNVEKSAIIASR